MKTIQSDDDARIALDEFYRPLVVEKAAASTVARALLTFALALGTCVFIAIPMLWWLGVDFRGFGATFVVFLSATLAAYIWVRKQMVDDDPLLELVTLAVQKKMHLMGATDEGRAWIPRRCAMVPDRLILESMGVDDAAETSHLLSVANARLGSPEAKRYERLTDKKFSDLSSYPNPHVCIIGNIGSGKSTAVSRVCKQLERTEQWNVARSDEPVDEWQKCGALKLFYENVGEPGIAAMWQSLVFATRVRQFVRARAAQAASAEHPLSLSEPTISMIVSDGWIECDRAMFVRQHLDAGTMTEAQGKFYDHIFDAYVDGMGIFPQPTLVIYLKSSPEECKKRVDKRNRLEEVLVEGDESGAPKKKGVDVDYLRALERQIERFVEEIRDETQGAAMLRLECVETDRMDEDQVAAAVVSKIKSHFH